nr:hypothetical protein [Tanacetum cinerariifolium]
MSSKEKEGDLNWSFCNLGTYRDQMVKCNCSGPRWSKGFVKLFCSGVCVKVLIFGYYVNKMDLSDIEVPRVFVTCRIRVNREECFLVSGLKFDVENSTDYNKAKDPIPFRRRVFSSDLDGRPIRGNDVGLLIESDVFKKLDDNDAVMLCRHFAVSVIRRRG